MTWGVPHKSNRQLTIGRNIPTGFFILLRKLFLSPSHIQTIQITSSTFGIIIIRVLVHNSMKDGICVKQVLRVGFFYFPVIHQSHWRRSVCFSSACSFQRRCINPSILFVFLYFQSLKNFYVKSRSSDRQLFYPLYFTTINLQNYLSNRLLWVGKKVVNKNITRGGRTTMKTELDTRALLNVKEMCEYLGIGQTKARELLSNPANGFTVRIGNRLYAHKGRLDHWLLNQILS